MIMLSATPHDGKPESFASLMNMLDPTAIVDPHDYAKEDFRDKGLVIRRFKKDVREQLAGKIPERETRICYTKASPAEEAAYNTLADVRFQTQDGQAGNVGQLFRTTLEKALFSSPAACLSTVNNRLKKIDKKLDKTRDEEQQTLLIEDYDSLNELKTDLEAIQPSGFSKYHKLLDVIRNDFHWKPNNTEDRLVIFTESIPTLHFLEEQLSQSLKLKNGQLAILGGHLADREIMQTVEDFGRRDSKIRLLLCSDVASEGINLHHLSHRMIHFDIPWSLMVFQQRNGRIDRYGQTHQPQIRYLQTTSQNNKIRGDARVLEILVKKDEQAGQNIGDPSEFFGLYDTDEEAAQTANAMEQEDSSFDTAAAFESLLEDNTAQSESPLAAFIPADRNDGLPIAELPNIFDNSLDYAQAAITWMRETHQEIDANIKDDTLALTIPNDLKQRLRYLPKEAWPKDNRFILSPKSQRVTASINRNLQDDDAPWAGIQYLWPLHPVMQWFRDKSLNAFGRHTAPVVRLIDKLAENEHIVLLHGGFPNRRGQLLVHDWKGVVIREGKVQQQLDWATLQSKLDLFPKKLINREDTSEVESLRHFLPTAVTAFRQRLKAQKQELVAERSVQLAEQKEHLKELKQRHEDKLQRELFASKQADTFKDSRRKRRQHEIDTIFEDFESWLANTQELEDEPYIQVVAVFTGG